MIVVKTFLKSISGCLSLCIACLGISAQELPPERIEWGASLTANASTGSLAPYMIGSWNGGRIVNGSGVWLDAYAEKKMRLDKRFSWGAGIEALAGISNAAAYERYDAATSTWSDIGRRQAPLMLHRLYAEVKFRGVYLRAGMKESHSWIVDDRFSSGDFTRSNNAAPIPGISAGFVDFQDIPFTRGWVQINGEIMYGRMMDNHYKENHYNFYNFLISRDLCYTYKYCYFRTKPSEPLSVTLGMQAAGVFGGNSVYYDKGNIIRRDDRGFHIRDIFDMFFPHEGSGEGFHKGNSLGSWDFNARYRFRNASELCFYFEWPWEDGSGIGRRNGWDGMWGLSYDFGRRGLLQKIVVEYLDYRNHSGPLHWAPADRPGTSLDLDASGGDNYYNNTFYGPYSNYGMAIGTPFIMSPAYNTDGFMAFAHNRTQGMHLAFNGAFGSDWDYMVKFSHQRAWGMGRVPVARALHNTSALVEAVWTPSSLVRGLSLRCQLAFDAGKLRGDNFGALLGVSYSADFKISKNSKK